MLTHDKTALVNLRNDAEGTEAEYQSLVIFLYILSYT